MSDSITREQQRLCYNQIYFFHALACLSVSVIAESIAYCI